MDFASRADFAVTLATAAGDLAKRYFADHTSLAIDKKGAQDWVSEADRKVELFVRDEIKNAFPDDGIVGEEFGATVNETGFTWVIDPIDGTTNFVNGIPNWTVVLAGVSAGETQVGVIRDPMMDETFSTLRGHGAMLNGTAMSVAHVKALPDGTVAVGLSNRATAENAVQIIAELVARGALFHRNASGALSLAYVASGRLLGYMEEHMNAWDCLAGQLLVEEAGGKIEAQNADAVIRDGGRIIASAPQVFDDLTSIAATVWQS